MGHCTSSAKRKVHINTGLPQETRNKSNNLTVHLKQLEKEEMKNPRVSRRKEILKIGCQFLKVLQVFIEPFNFSFFSITGWGIGLDYHGIEWFALEMKRDHSVVLYPVLYSSGFICVSSHYLVLPRVISLVVQGLGVSAPTPKAQGLISSQEQRFHKWFDMALCQIKTNVQK